MDSRPRHFEPKPADSITPRRSHRALRFEGLGAQADGFLHSERNTTAGVSAEDVALNEQRTAAMKLAHARLFVDVRWFDPGLSGKVTEPSALNVLHLVRQLQFHQMNGTKCNLVLFAPAAPGAEEVPVLVRSMVNFLRHLIQEHGLVNIVWLTLWNEPETIFPFDSPLSRRVWGDDRIARRPGYEVYRAANRLAGDLMQETQLQEQVKLIVADAVWGSRVRRQQLELALEAFHDLDVVYAYHNYNPEDLAFYAGNEDFAYGGMGKEAAEFRALLGPDRPLFVTEFNSSTGVGFNSHCLGFGPGGSEWVGSIRAAVDTAVKVLEALNHGVNALSYWCLQDMIYLNSHEVMPMGLWRYKSQGWAPRPAFHYYGLLMDVLRPGSKILKSSPPADGIFSLFIQDAKVSAALFLNDTFGMFELEIPVALSGPLQILRVDPIKIPPLTDVPFRSEEMLADKFGGKRVLRLQMGELVACLQVSPDQSPEETNQL